MAEGEQGSCHSALYAEIRAVLRLYGREAGGRGVRSTCNDERWWCAHTLLSGLREAPLSFQLALAAPDPAAPLEWKGPPF